MTNTAFPELPVILAPLSEEDGGGWMARFLDLPGCMGDGDTPEEALGDLRSAAQTVAEIDAQVFAALRPETHNLKPFDTEQDTPPDPEGSAYKQILVVRKDLGMTRGKESAQCAHASQILLLKNRTHVKVLRWLSGPFTKIVVSVDNEEAFHLLKDKAEQAGLLVAAVRDSGLTQFKGQKTWTAMAIGPDTDDVLKPITGHLKLR